MTAFKEKKVPNRAKHYFGVISVTWDTAWIVCGVLYVMLLSSDKDD